MLSDTNFIDVRKLSGRLLCEALHESRANQDFFSDLLSLDAICGRVTLNKTLPVFLKKRLASEPEFLYSLHRLPRSDQKKRRPAKPYWTFPEFKELSSAVLTKHAINSVHPDLNVSSQHDNLARLETTMEYLNFPDPQLFLIGFEIEHSSGDFDSRSSPEEVALDISASGLKQEDHCE